MIQLVNGDAVVKKRKEREMETLCDKCGSVIEDGYEESPDNGEWEGATLCSDCYAVVTIA